MLELSYKEYLNGWLSKPTPITLDDTNKTLLSPRFCISEQHGKQQAKFRVVDDLSRSQANSTADTSDTYCPENMDVLVTQSRTFANLGRTDLKAWSVDFPNAYKLLVYTTIRSALPMSVSPDRVTTNRPNPRYWYDRLAASGHHLIGEE